MVSYSLHVTPNNSKINVSKLSPSGGSVCQDQKESTFILTAIKSRSRIDRIVKNYKAPVIDIQWVKECDKAKKALPFDKYLLVEGSQQLPLTHIVTRESAEILNRKFKNLPPEELQFEDESSGNTSADDASDDGEENIEIDPTFTNTKYECLRPTPYVPKYNKRLISFLLILERKRQLDSEDKRSLSYRHAISALKAYPRDIKSSKEAEKIIGVGKKMSEKIRMFLSTGTIEEAELLRSDERFRTISLFNQVFGVGAVTANIWWKMGYRTLQEVLDKEKLSPVVRLGIMLLPDFSQLMSPEDVKQIANIIRNQLQAIDNDIIIIPVGGYRRGKTKNGDLDLLISSHHVPINGLLDKVVNVLVQSGYIKHKLWKSTDNNNSKQQKKLHGTSGSRQIFDDFEKCFCAVLQPSTGIHRQVDLIVVPPKELPMAILGWTGSRQFERSLREYAKKEKSMTVNSHSIHHDINGLRKKIVVKSEEEAFSILGIPYLHPEMRNC
ncbi:hypothetical protein INT47_011732 [Mucor saturninus]|uniref:DNA polymerase lambda n=1 Tax=Mucor saturninus TaxID=64648 RepID=A0A8H7R5G5_9FUNG|nr:hypothetical protein INT47_011732 [Mucor saturninus]